MKSKLHVVYQNHVGENSKYSPSAYTVWIETTLREASKWLTPLGY